MDEQNRAEPADFPGGVRMTSPMLKAMTHPLRRRIIDLMSEDVPRRAVDLAELLDTPANTVSFHLRQLAKAGFIREAPEMAHDKRDRMWVATGSGFGVPTPENPIDAEGEATMRALIDQERLDLHDMISRILAWAPEWSSGRDPEPRAELNTGVLELTREESRQLSQEVHDVFQRYRRKAGQPSEEPRLLWRIAMIMADDTLPRHPAP